MADDGLFEPSNLLFYALFTGHHCLLLGRTGSAKSLLVNQILGALEANGSRLFSIKASIDDTKDNYFGPIDVVSYREKGVKVRHTGRSILDAGESSFRRKSRLSASTNFGSVMSDFVSFPSFFHSSKVRSLNLTGSPEASQ